MPCIPFEVNGARGFICTRGQRRRKCSVCKRPTASRECDWKKPKKKSGTCDAPLCDRCTFSPAEDKDLCPDHATAYEAWVKQRGLPTIRP
jgi:hypothetical protein